MRGFGVVNDRLCVGLDGLRAIADGRSHPVGSTTVTVCCDNNVGTLTDAQSYDICLIRFDGDLKKRRGQLLSLSPTSSQGSLQNRLQTLPLYARQC